MKNNPVKKIKDYLKENRVEFVSYYHNPVYTTEDLARHLNVPLVNVVKTYLLEADGEHIMLVIPSQCEIDMEKLRGLLSKNNVSFPPEGVQKSIFPDCEADALPPFGNLYGVPVYTETLLENSDELLFLAGTFRDSIKLKFSDFKRLVNPARASYCCEYN